MNAYLKIIVIFHGVCAAFALYCGSQALCETTKDRLPKTRKDSVSSAQSRTKHGSEARRRKSEKSSAVKRPGRSGKSTAGSKTKREPLNDIRIISKDEKPARDAPASSLRPVPRKHPRPQPAVKPNRPVWIVFFGSHDCPHCMTVESLLEALKTKYPIHTKTFDVEHEADQALLRRVEAVHSQGRLSVPVVIIGESILVGENEITRTLEKTVRSLIDCGAPPPYLGEEDERNEPVAENPEKSSRCPCEKKGRPPTVEEEWKKVKTVFDKLFETEGHDSAVHREFTERH